jgi:hypothetical protein
MLCGREWAGGNWKGGGAVMKQLALSKGPPKMGIRHHGQGADNPSKSFLFMQIHALS